MSDFVPKIIRATEENINLATEAAEEDGCSVAGASHIILKDNECVGYIGIATIPSIQFWFHHRKMKVRDSLYVMNFAEEVMNHQILPKGGVFFLPTHTSSPLYPYAKRIDYQPTTYDKVLIKKLSPT